MKPEPPIYIPPPEPQPLHGWWLIAGVIGGIVFIAGMCLIAVEAAALWECAYKGICN